MKSNYQKNKPKLALVRKFDLTLSQKIQKEKALSANSGRSVSRKNMPRRV